MLCDIYGLRFLRQPLEFLGLFNCDSASHFGSLPAKSISGDATEDQVSTLSSLSLSTVIPLYLNRIHCLGN